jgi:signal transduction histidine kinase
MELPVHTIEDNSNKLQNLDFELFQDLSYKIINYSNLGLSLSDFLKNILKVLINYTQCNSIEIWIQDNDKYIHCTLTPEDKESFQFEFIYIKDRKGKKKVPNLPEDSFIARLLIDIIDERFDASLPYFTKRGSFWTGNIDNYVKKKHKTSHDIDSVDKFYSKYKSIAMIPISGEDGHIGILQMMKCEPNSFQENKILVYESITQTISLGLTNQKSRTSLRERIKEITCLYEIGLIINQQISISEMLQKIVGILPPAWQYPQITSARILLDGDSYSAPGFQQGGQRQKSNIIVKGERRGSVEIIYLEKRPVLDEGPFLTEERNLIDTVARQLSILVEGWDEKENRSSLEKQVRHADRLATLGQLTAGMAHEINEPLNSILGFSQLITKTENLPNQIKKDIKKIEKASLYARDIIRKLMLFSRQIQPQTNPVNINEIVTESLYLLQSRCDKAGIEIDCSLASDLPEIMGDETLLNQVLLNLVLNSIQAMPNGGKLKIKTSLTNGCISLMIIDTGVGISKEIIDKIFMPFFTTKDVDEGTGLGLSVVHGIIAIHKGTLRVESRLDHGTQFEIKLPIK